MARLFAELLIHYHLRRASRPLLALATPASPAFQLSRAVVASDDDSVGYVGGRDHAESPGLYNGAAPYLRRTIERHIFLSGIFRLAMLSQSRQPGKTRFAKPIDTANLFNRARARYRYRPRSLIVVSEKKRKNENEHEKRGRPRLTRRILPYPLR
jgi:hypothetical protein